MARKFSLDCEKLWGMPSGVKRQYIENNIKNAEQALSSICEAWCDEGATLYLAFVINSISPSSPTAIQEKQALKDRGFKPYLSDEYLYFYGLNRLSKKKTILYGLHGSNHELYSEMNPQEVEAELESVESFLESNQGFDKLFVYPKNLVDSISIKKYKKWFSYVRVNSRSWLYRTNKGGPKKFKRLLRYLDSFLPIYEFFCLKEPEHDIDNSTVGTHFYRANLSPPLLVIHYLRLRFGVFFMGCIGRDVHIWSHPHNFSGSQFSVKLFCSLQGTKGFMK